MIYELSNCGRAVTYSRWRKVIKGCGLPSNTSAYVELGVESRWDNEFPTLGQIADACPYTGRCLARFAMESGHDLMVKEYNQSLEPTTTTECSGHKSGAADPITLVCE